MNEGGIGFVAGTMVLTKGGLKPIESVAIGELVLSHPEDMPIPRRKVAPFRLEDEYTYRAVTNIVTLNSQSITRLIATDGDKETILLAARQAVFLKGRGWVEAAKIEAGDCLWNSNFANALVFRNYPAHSVEQTFALEIDGFQTYYVGERCIWIHC